MACVQSASANADSEMEEGEIVDEADDLSDISSEEEFLLRQRLQVLENYNNVLERKEAKRSSIGSGKQHRRIEALYDGPNISGADADRNFSKLTLRITREQKPIKLQQKQRKYKQNEKAVLKFKEHKECRKKNHRNRKKIAKVSDSETSEVSDDEYRNKRQRLEDAVSLSKVKSDTTTLKDRLTKMLCVPKPDCPHIEENLAEKSFNISETVEICNDELLSNKEQNDLVSVEKLEETPIPSKPKTDCCDEKELQITSNTISQYVVDSEVIENKKKLNSESNSDEDLDLLRQLALKTKSIKYKIDMPSEPIISEIKPVTLSEDEDSDTAELRMICLKSAFLKKAIEIKQKQKLQKRFSQSSIVSDEFDIAKAENDINVDNNTDIESVDMDMGSDAEDKGKIFNDCSIKNETDTTNVENDDKVISERALLKDELEDDEDLLRAKLLTALSKNLPNLVDVNVLEPVLVEPQTKCDNTVKVQPSIQEEKKFIIELGQSDSDDGENEATKNLTKMHVKLSEKQEFQNKLDIFLKSTRMEVEKNKLPDVVQRPLTKSPIKFVAKAMNHLPKSEQIEYKNLVKRMAELEKMKQARQNTVVSKMPVKETLKPRNMSLDAYKIALAKKNEEKIALSRRRIAEESEKMLKLKEEATKLSQKYKIVATELRNIATAITINKKQQRVVQNGLSKIRHQHQLLLKSSPSKHFSNQNNNQILNQVDKLISTAKLQKENNPSKEEYKNPSNLKSVHVSIVNNLNSDTNTVPQKLSVQVDITNNKKVVKLPKSPLQDRVVGIQRQKSIELKEKSESVNNIPMEKGRNRKKSKDETELHDVVPADVNDYKSPLDSLQCKNWEEDPNGVLCPFEVGGSCRDPDCKYLHPKIHKSE